MMRTLIRAVLAVALLAVGWTVGRAQTTYSAPDFEVAAPVGETVVECVRGCELLDQEIEMPF
jgi:hypothetical protein